MTTRTLALDLVDKRAQATSRLWSRQQRGCANLYRQVGVKRAASLCTTLIVLVRHVIGRDRSGSDPWGP